MSTVRGPSLTLAAAPVLGQFIHQQLTGRPQETPFLILPLVFELHTSTPVILQGFTHVLPLFTLIHSIQDQFDSVLFEQRPLLLQLYLALMQLVCHLLSGCAEICLKELLSTVSAFLDTVRIFTECEVEVLRLANRKGCALFIPDLCVQSLSVMLGLLLSLSELLSLEKS